MIVLRSINSNGRLGIILPTGIATGDTTKVFFEKIVNNHQLVSLYDFMNTGVFTGVQRNVRFCLLTVSNKYCETFTLAVQLSDASELKEKVYQLSKEDIQRINPNTGNCPMFMTKRDAEIVKNIYNKFPCLILETHKIINIWGISFMRMFDSSNDSELFKTYEQLVSEGYTLEDNIFRNSNNVYMPLYESKLTNQYNHRASTFAGVPSKNRFGTHPKTMSVDVDNLQDTHFRALPRYWIPKNDVISKVSTVSNYGWLMGVRRTMSAVADSRSVVFNVFPFTGTSDSIFLLFSSVALKKICVLISLFNSFLLDYIARQKASGGNLSYFIIKQLPFPDPNNIPLWLINFIVPRVIELTYTSTDIKDFAKDTGFVSSPFIWNEERRKKIQCEMDAAIFRFFGLPKKDIDYILETFNIVQNRDIEQFGEYRTKRLILEAWDRMQEAIDNGTEYVSMVDPPPAHPSLAHPNRDGSVYEGPGLVLTEEPVAVAKPRPSKPAEDEKPTAIKEPSPAPPKEKKPTTEKKFTEPTDYGLYKCSGCGQMVMGFDKENHTQLMHGGEELGYRKL